MSSFYFLLFVICPLYVSSLENFIFKLEQSQSDLEVWTTLPTKHVFKDDEVPSNTQNAVNIYLAQNEYEPCQIIIKASSDRNVDINLISTDNSTNANEQALTSEFFYVDYVPITEVTDEGIGARVGDTPDVIFPANYSTFALKKNENFPLWILFNASVNATPILYNYTLTIGSIQVPIKVKVFNFSIPSDIHFYSQMGVSFESVLAKYSSSSVSNQYWEILEKFKYWLIQHRITPKGPLWSGGLTSSGCPYISYNCTTNQWKDTDGIWGFEINAEKYIKGDGFNNGHGFPHFISLYLKNNDASTEQRCSTLCDTSPASSDWPITNTSTTYNALWLDYYKSIQDYLEGLDLLNQTYVYLWNEPQDDTDYKAVACSSKAMQAKAPKLKKMVSEEPKPQIFNNSYCPDSKIDIWLPIFNMYNHSMSWERLRDYSEETWIYHLCHNNRPPFFNFVTLDHEPIENMFVGLFHWKYRVRGLAYYVFNNWANNPYTTPNHSEGNGAQFLFYPPAKNNSNVPFGTNGNRFVSSQRLEILRDSIEFYEYFWLMNNKSLAKPYETSYIDDLITNKIILGEKSYLRDDNYIYNLRKYAGMYLGGEIDFFPDVSPDCKTSRCAENATNYYINFQNASDPAVTFENISYMAIDWSPYNQTAGYGWWGLPDQRKYGAASSNDPRLNSILYDDYGRVHTFEFDLPRGRYDVTVSVGWNQRTYRNNTVKINGIIFFLEVETNPNVSYVNVTKQIYCYSNKLFMEIGDGKEYTMLNYMIIKINTTNIGFNYFSGNSSQLDEDLSYNSNNSSSNNSSNTSNSSSSSHSSKMLLDIINLFGMLVIFGILSA